MDHSLRGGVHMQENVEHRGQYGEPGFAWLLQGQIRRAAHVQLQHAAVHVSRQLLARARRSSRRAGLTGVSLRCPAQIRSHHNTQAVCPVKIRIPSASLRGSISLALWEKSSASFCNPGGRAASHLSL